MVLQEGEDMYGEAICGTDVVRQACIGTVLLAGTWSDLKMQKVKNRMILAGCALGILLAVQAARPPDIAGSMLQQQFPVMLLSGIWNWGKHFLWTIAVLYIFFVTGALGAGDVKLCAVAAGMMSFREIRCMLTASLLMGAMTGFLHLTEKLRLNRAQYHLQALPGGPGCALQGSAAVRGGRGGNEGKVHFTVFITAGYLVTLLMGIGT